MRLRFAGYRFNLVPESETRFRVKHPLVDVGYITAEFFADREREEDALALNIGNVFFFVGRKMPTPERSAIWDQLVGEYVVEETEASLGVKAGICIVNETLRISIKRTTSLSPQEAILHPLSEEEIVMLDGHWAGETIFRDPDTGELNLAGLTFMPLSRD